MLVDADEVFHGSYALARYSRSPQNGHLCQPQHCRATSRLCQCHSIVCTGRAVSVRAQGFVCAPSRSPNDLCVRSSLSFDLALVGTGFAYAVERRAAQAAAVSRLLGEVRDLRRSGVASLDLCSVAAGWLDGYYEVGLKRWDWAAGVLVAEEAPSKATPTLQGIYGWRNR